jgi:ubiquitin carboxyl-terminal hydrolase 34
MRLEISQRIRAPWDSFNIASQNSVLNFSENGKVIRDLRLKRGEVFVITRRPTRPIPEAELVDKKGNLLPDAQLVF